MKAPFWFKAAMIIWLCIGIPIFIIGSGFRGYFSIIPDPPPFVYSEHLLDQTVGTLLWIFANSIVYLPFIAIPALLVWRLRKSEKSNAKN